MEKELIYREQKGKKSHTTYLIPYNNTFIKHKALLKRDTDNQSVLDDLVVKLQRLQSLYGEIVRVFHLFQWGTDKKSKPDIGSGMQKLLVITKRKNDILIGHVHHLIRSNHLSINEMIIEETSVFNSPFKYIGTNVTGIALEHDVAVENQSGAEEMSKLLINLANIEEWRFEELPKVQYGEKDKFFPPEVTNTKENEG
ncbi:hypothetical protein ACT7DE_18500 [Bacillus paranthracis]